MGSLKRWVWLFGALRILLDTSTPFPEVKEFLPLDGWFFDASEDHRYFEAMNLEGQQILSEGFPVRSFTITWELGMPRLKLDFQSRILSQGKFFLHTWSFFLPFVTLQLLTYLGKRPQQKIGVQFVFLVSLTKISFWRKRRVLRICLLSTDDHLHSYCRYASRVTWIGMSHWYCWLSSWVLQVVYAGC